MPPTLFRNPTRFGRRGRASLRMRSESGFTLIEVLVSALLVALISASVADALVSTSDLSQDQRNRAVGHNLAQQDEERLRGMSAEQLTGLNQVRYPVWVSTSPGSNTYFTVTSSAQFVGSHSGTCSTSAAAYFKTTSTVTWTTVPGGPQQSATEESIITPPAGGSILAQVVDQTGTAGVQGVTVAANGPDYESGLTDANGCVLLASLPSGSYSLTYGKTNYIDPTGNASPTATSSVTNTGTASTTPTPIMMGNAGTITGNLADAASCNGSTCRLGGEADALSWLGTGSSTGMSSPADVTSASASTQFTTGKLFPFAWTGPSYTNNYQLWAGKCAQMRPPSGQDMFSVPPGSVQTAAVEQPEIDLTVTNNGAPITPSHVKITFNSTSGTACSDSWYATVGSNSTGVLANPGQPFASTATSGSNESASGQTGTLSICADNGTDDATATGVTDSFTSATAVKVAITSNRGRC